MVTACLAANFHLVDSTDVVTNTFAVKRGFIFGLKLCQKLIIVHGMIVSQTARLVNRQLSTALRTVKSVHGADNEI
jgi:hypothetical protein